MNPPDEATPPGRLAGLRPGGMKLDLLVVGGVVALGGLVLIVAHGVVFGTNIPQALGIPCSGGTNQTFCPGFASYSIGTVVLLAGLPLVLRGLTTSASPAFGGSSSAGSVNPETLAALLAASRTAPPPAGGAPTPATGGVRFCTACGQSNIPSASFCNRCGKPMPAATP